MSVVWVIGAGGFLGRHVARHFARQGWRVAGLGRGQWSSEAAAEWGVSAWLSADVTAQSLTALAALAGQPRVVVNAAGSGSVGEVASSPYAAFTDTVAATAAIVDHLRTSAPDSLLLQTSSAAVYGKQPPGPIAEDVAFNPLSLYGTHKVMAEMLCRSAATHYGQSCWIVRFFSLYGSGLRKQLFWDLALKLQQPGGRVVLAGTGAETRDFLHVQDAARLMYQLACRGGEGCGAVNGGTGIASTVAAAATVLADALDTRCIVAFNGESRPGDPQHYQADTVVARQLGFQPEWTLERGLADYAAWMRQTGDWR